MRIIATINANLGESPIGTRSRLRESLDGTSIIRRTVERVCRIRGIAEVFLLVRPMDAEEARGLLDGLDVRIETHDAPPAPYLELVRAGRAWGLDGWRGGIGSLCVFDEDCDVSLLHAVAEKARADAILSIPAAAPLLDADLLSAMVDHFNSNIEMARLTIMQVPPGLTGLILASDVLGQLQSAAMPPGAMLVHQPQSPAPDLTGREGCYRPAAAIVRARGRLLCDTTQSVDRVQRIIDAGGTGWTASEICQWMEANDRHHVSDAPTEIEIELTTEDQFGSRDLLHPRGDGVPTRGPVDLSVIDRVVAGIAARDDVRIVLAGFGEPTLHPRFAEICGRLRAGGAHAICVRTNAIALPAAADAALFDTPVDVVEVALDAASAETYQRVHGIDAFDKVMATVDRWIELRAERQSVRPLIVPSFTKAHETLDDLEPFVDHWQRALGTCVVRGASHFAGQRADRAVTTMAPPLRGPCWRVASRMVVLADGTVTTCDQDYAGLQAQGNLLRSSLDSLWRGEGLSALRSGKHDHCTLCPKCDEWHRP